MSIVTNVMLFQSSLRPDSLPWSLLVHLLVFISQFLPYLIGTGALSIVIIIISHFGNHLSAQPIIFPTQDRTDVFWVEQQMKEKNHLFVFRNCIIWNPPLFKSHSIYFAQNHIQHNKMCTKTEITVKANLQLFTHCHLRHKCRGQQLAESCTLFISNMSNISLVDV